MEHLNLTHSILRWILLLVAVVTIARAFLGMKNKWAFGAQDNKLGLMLTSLFDLQLLIGLALYFMSPWGLKNIQNMGMSVIMKNSFYRFFAIEHITGMLIAVVLIHIGRSKSKKAIDDYTKHKKAFWFYLIALLIVLATIPWPFKEGFAGVGWY